MRKRLGVRREPRVVTAAHTLFAKRRKGVGYSAWIIKEVRRISREGFAVVDEAAVQDGAESRSERQAPITEYLNMNRLPRPCVSAVATHHEIFPWLIHVSVYQSAHSFLFYAFGQSCFALRSCSPHPEGRELK